MEVVHQKQHFFNSYSEECKILVMCNSALNTNANVLLCNYAGIQVMILQKD